MKRLLFFAGMAFLAFGCNDKTSSTATQAADTSKVADAGATELNYAYTLERPYNDWRPGDKQHAVTAMSALKGFETGDITACMAGFGDSIEIRFDGFFQKFSKDSLTKFFTAERNNMASMKVKMGDWESVVSKDGKEEYVTMWYKQTVTDKKGRTDSVNVVNDCKFMNGKIVELDEKIQHFPKKS